MHIDTISRKLGFSRRCAQVPQRSRLPRLGAMTCWPFQPTNHLLRCLYQHGHATIRRRAAGRSVFFTEETDAVCAAGIAQGVSSPNVCGLKRARTNCDSCSPFSIFSSSICRCPFELLKKLLIGRCDALCAKHVKSFT